MIETEVETSKSRLGKAKTCEAQDEKESIHDTSHVTNEEIYQKWHNQNNSPNRQVGELYCKDEKIQVTKTPPRPF